MKMIAAIKQPAKNEAAEHVNLLPSLKIFLDFIFLYNLTNSYLLIRKY